MSWMDRFNSKQLTIVIVCITAFFITMAVFTLIILFYNPFSSFRRRRGRL